MVTLRERLGGPVGADPLEGSVVVHVHPGVAAVDQSPVDVHASPWRRSAGSGRTGPSGPVTGRTSAGLACRAAASSWWPATPRDRGTPPRRRPRVCRCRAAGPSRSALAVRLTSTVSPSTTRMTVARWCLTRGPVPASPPLLPPPPPPVMHGHGFDSQTTPSPSASSRCGSADGLWLLKKFWAWAWVSKSPQSMSPTAVAGEVMVSVAAASTRASRARGSRGAHGFLPAGGERTPVGSAADRRRLSGSRVFVCPRVPEPRFSPPRLRLDRALRPDIQDRSALFSQVRAGFLPQVGLAERS